MYFFLGCVFFPILRGLEYGAAYSFDEESYNRFYPIANKAGLEYLGPEDFSENSQMTGQGIHIVRIQKMNVSGN